MGKYVNRYGIDIPKSARITQVKVDTRNESTITYVTKDGKKRRERIPAWMARLCLFCMEAEVT